jgi:hypothetical protein|tara:strand:+ start:225 stop:434 length:210 start_codon:yes stop_codon:yes gene_type:complete
MVIVTALMLGGRVKDGGALFDGPLMRSVEEGLALSLGGALALCSLCLPQLIDDNIRRVTRRHGKLLRAE